MPEQRGQHDWSFNRRFIGEHTWAAADLFEARTAEFLRLTPRYFHNCVTLGRGPIFDAVAQQVLSNVGENFPVQHDPGMAAARELVLWTNSSSVVPTGLEIGEKARVIAARIREALVGAA